MRKKTPLEFDLTSKRWNADIARRLLAAWRRSGQPMAAFVRGHGVSAQRLSWWQKRLAGEGSPSRTAEPLAFIPAVVKPQPLAEASARVVVRFAGSVEVEGETGAMPTGWLAELAREIGKVAP